MVYSARSSEIRRKKLSVENTGTVIFGGGLLAMIDSRLRYRGTEYALEELSQELSPRSSLNQFSTFGASCTVAGP